MFRRATLAVLLFSPRLGAAQGFEAGVEAAVAGFSPAAAKAVPQAPVRVDLSYQFPDGPRDQGRMNSCHAFVAVALVEAAWFRAYGAHLRLSEADLFVRTLALPGVPFLRRFEGGLARRDLRRALDGGVLPGDYYAEFEARWHARAAGAAELLPESLTPEAEAAREAVRAGLAGFEAGGASFLSFAGANARSILKKGRVRCAVGRRERILLGQLDAGRPVAVGLHTGWTEDPAWRRGADGEGGSHYFVVTGYERTPEGLVFRTRNTWTSGVNPDLAGRDLCEVFGMTWLTAPAER